MDSAWIQNLQSPLKESVSGGQAPPTFSPYLMNAHFLGHKSPRTLCHNFSCYFSTFPWLKNTKGAHPFPFTLPKKKSKKCKKAGLFFLRFFSQENHTDYWMDAISFRLLIYKKDCLFFNRKIYVFVSHSLNFQDFFFFCFCKNQKELLWEIVLIFIERTEHIAINTGA